MSTTIFDIKRPIESPERDPSTLSNYYAFNVNLTDIEYHVDWEKKILVGKVIYDLSIKESSQPSSIILDTSYLNVFKASINDEETPFVLDEKRLEPLGTKLSIPLHKWRTKTSSTKAQLKLSLEFSTTEKVTAVQWLEPEQTAGKTAPYLFSQCEAIHARSMYPCFDTPSVKSPMNISIYSIYPTVSSGNVVSKPSKPGSEIEPYVFKQELPIPSYLFAIASGDISNAPIGPRSLIYSEPSFLQACQYEFEADTEKFIEVAEKIVFPYEWKTYNVLILPPSFPYGGMENPNITFATPTLISGDRQNVDVIAHELAHSWSGNLVTNCSWEHFWLNEGWTMYLERRIVGSIHGEAYRHFSAIIGWKDLQDDIDSMSPATREKYSPLVVDLSNLADPDDAFSTVPYEKGFNLLFLIEQKLGGFKEFDPFIPFYFTKFRTQSLDTYQFKDTLYEFFKHKKDILDEIDWDTWFYSPGMPPVKPDFDTSLADACYALSAKWVDAALNAPKNATISYFKEKFSVENLKGWNSQQYLVFLDSVTDSPKIRWSDAAPSNAVKALGEIYKFESSSNPEVISRWFKIAVKARLGHESTYNPLANWLGTVGRMKFVRPGFRELAKVDKPLAISTFKKNELFYHPICRNMVSRDLGL
ncbi:uncharacterized protein SAPINGB_P003861 [Magnusiomyces paraingens]|uniref:Leukotriene A(4) hydrolase n=1 Tax=Magnusiomyces paraingens TaxID=2606893 RepID=A0A5E8BTR1_9ASCO|nr:uncharacterized protein SAPINGB_P003861 [Saprochaete ingens]VVT54009.1 unnamed protein product [Saprochaete ingens]